MFFIVNIKKSEQDIYEKEVLDFDSVNVAKAELHKIIGANYDLVMSATDDICGFTVSMLDARGFCIYNESSGMDDIPQPQF